MSDQRVQEVVKQIVKKVNACFEDASKAQSLAQDTSCLFNQLREVCNTSCNSAINILHLRVTELGIFLIYKTEDRTVIYNSFYQALRPFGILDEIVISTRVSRLLTHSPQTASIGSLCAHLEYLVPGIGCTEFLSNT